MSTDTPHIIDMPDGSRLIITLEERAATGSTHVKVVYDSNRTRKTMFVKASSDNVITIHSIKEP
jgi:hypothetical protein